MQTLRTWIVFIWLSGTILSGLSLNSWHEMGANFENSSEAHELETAAIPPLEIDTAVTLLDTNISGATLPAEEYKDERLQMELEAEMEQQRVHFKKHEARRRRRRSAWGRRKYLATVEDNAYRTAGLGRPLMDWRNRGRGELDSSALMAILRELYAEKRRLTGQKKWREEEEEDDDDSDDDEEEEEEEEEEGEEEEEEEGNEEEEEVEATEPPTNQTETQSNFTGSPLSDCQTGDREIICRGIGMTHLPVVHNLEATKLDVAENNISSLAPQDFSDLLNLDTVDLSQNKLDDESFSQKPLSNLTFLKRLNLDGNQLTRIPAALPLSVEELKINSNNLSTLTPECFKGLVNLLTLELRGNSLHEGSVSPRAFRPLEMLLNLQLDNNFLRSLPLGIPPSLQILKMNGNLIEEVPEKALRRCVHLKVLDLSHNLLHEQSISNRTWTRLKSLEALDLSYNQFTSVPVNLPRPLRNLTLQHNNISHIPIFTFRHLRPGLESLCLSHNALRNEGIERVSLVGTYRSLGELLLDNNHLTEVPGCVRQFKNLQVLRLDNNRIRLVRQWGVCHPRNSGSTLASVHLENNLLEVEKIAPNTFSCLTDAQGLVLYPQQ